MSNEPTVARPSKDRAIVIGGSVAGLTAARVLADHFNEVIVVERDARPDGPTHRKGAPQMRHVHVLLEPSIKALEGLFPGFLGELVGDGALRSDFGNSPAVHHYGAWKPRFVAGIDVVQCSRPLIEWRVRQRVEALANVKIRYEHAAEGLLTTPDRGRITGARLKGAAGQEELSADLVVDAAGRGTRAPRWLEALGYGRPKEQAIGIDLAYVTRRYERPRDFGADWDGLVVTPRAPSKRGAFILPVEGGCWLASMTGLFGDHCPLDEAGYLEFARSLAVPDAYEALKGAKALSEPVMHKIPSSRWFHYETMDRLPERLLLVGDSVCSLNPLYGQGMTVSIQCVMELEASLAERARRGGDLGGLPKEYQSKVAKILVPPWMLSTTMDLVYPEAEGDRPFGAGAVQWVFGNFLDLASVSQPACQLLYELIHMRRGPEALLKPQNLLPLLSYCAKSLVVPRGERINKGSTPRAAPT